VAGLVVTCGGDHRSGDVAAQTAPAALTAAAAANLEVFVVAGLVVTCGGDRSGDVAAQTAPAALTAAAAVSVVARVMVAVIRRSSFVVFVVVPVSYT
jgi:hypothetical protein